MLLAFKVILIFGELREGTVFSVIITRIVFYEFNFLNI